MSDDLYGEVYDDDTNDGGSASSGPKALRDAYEAEKTARKALEERLAKIETESRQTKLASALKASGVNPKAAGLVPADVTPDKVGEWLTEWADVLGIKQEQQQGGVTTEVAQSIAAVSGEPDGTAPSTPADAAANLAGIDNEADFWKAIRANQ